MLKQPENIYHPDPDKQQQKAAKPDTSVWVSASAGTGKTKVLTDRVFNLLLSGVRPEKILCLTFTKAAAAEMSNRIASKLSKWAILSDKELEQTLEKLLEKYPDNLKDEKALKTTARRLFSQVLDTPGGMRIQTIHSFCQTLLKQFPIEAGIAPHFIVMDDRDAEEAINNVKSYVLSRHYNDENVHLAFKKITSTISDFSFDEVLKSITYNRQQIQSMLSHYGSIDNVIKEIKGKLNLQPDETTENVIAKVCQDENINAPLLREAIPILKTGGQRNKKNAEALATWLEMDKTNRTNNFGLFTSAFLKKDGEPLKEMAVKKIREEYPDIEKGLRDVQEYILRIHGKLKSLRTAEATEALLTIGQAICNCYQDYKTKRSLMDYDDLINATKKLLETSGIAEWVLFKLDGGIDHILVDEAQDTNPSQWSIIKSLSEEFFSHHNENADIKPRTIFAVGDRKQSIFSFQGADPEAFESMRLKLQNQIPAAGYKWDEVDLYTSFRSTKAVLQAVNCVIQQAEARDGILLPDEDGTHIACKGRIDDGGLVEIWPPLNPTAIDEPEPWKPPVERVRAPSIETRMARIVASRINLMIKNKEILEAQNRLIKAGDIMVLVRKRDKFITELVKELKNLDVETAGADRITLTKQIAVKDLIALGNFLLMPKDDLTLATVLKTPFIGMSEEDLFLLSYDRKYSLWKELRDRQDENESFKNAFKLLSELLSIGSKSRPYELYSHILGKLGGREKIMRRLGAEAMDAIDEFIALTISFEKSHNPSLQLFLQWVSSSDVEIKRDMEQEDLDAVRIMTIHGSKGLQAPIVFMAGTLQKPSATPSLLWHNKKQKDSLLFWPPSSAKDNIDSFSESILDKEKHEQNKEYRRLLYVAMTRAEDRLYVCGHNNSRKPEQDCWYNLIHSGLSTIATEENDDFIQKYFGEDTIKLRLISQQKKNIQPIEMTAQNQTPQINNKPPSWLKSKPSAEPTPPKPLAPSLPAELEPAALSPISHIKNKKTKQNIFGRGTLIHKLLQMLPDIPSKNRLTAAYQIIKNANAQITNDEADQIVSSTIEVINNEQFRHIFSSSSRAEVPVIGVINNTVISGIVDRLVITEKEVLIVDYKTNKIPPKTPDKIPQIYKSQMASYANVLQSIYPKKEVKTAILWTETPAIMHVN
ncbi:MAG: double-strand break repair helicase AddA [Alphaproteobacteria bacterium]|nr:double-strand break repair helicase AddA [Alphaproteobacteria bacterium]